MSQWNDPQADPTRQYRRDPAVDPYAQAPVPAAPPPHQNPFGTEGNDQFGIASMVFSLLGGILLIVCLTTLEWFSTSANGSLSFGDVRNLTGAGATAGFATAYFGWFAWTFLLISVAAAIGASFPSPALRALRVLGVVTAFAAAGLSFLALQVNTARSYTSWLGDARIGFYLGVVGFVLIGVGAAIGPRRVSSRRV